MSWRSVILLAGICTLGAHGTALRGGDEVDRSGSYLLAITGKSGLFSFAAHEHAILATEWSVDASVDPANLAGSSVAIRIPVRSLVIDSADALRLAGRGSGPGADDVRKIQEQMLGPRVLDAEQHPEMEFRSTSVEPVGEGRLLLKGLFTMRGRTHEIEAPVRYARKVNGGYDFSGEFTVKQTGFGIQPYSFGGGMVKVKDEVRIRFLVSMKPGP